MTGGTVRLRPLRAAPVVGPPPRVRALDGVRALAVAAVVAYHLDGSALPGGYLGVDVFFVLSGFLITTLLLHEYEEQGRVSLPGFWRRRARRLLPPLVVTLVSVAVLTPTLYADVAARLRGELLAALAQGGNWFEALAGRSYFEELGRPSPLRHLWSLGVEAQFYAVWPLLAVVAVYLGGRRFVGATAAVGAALSFLAMALFFTPGSDPSRLYYGTDTRVGTLLVGAVLAAACPIGGRRRPLEGAPRVVVDLVGVAALAGLAALVLTLEGTSVGAYRGGFLLVALLTAMVLTVAVHPDAWLGKVLSFGPLVWLGTRSYAVYLWHWPVFVATRPDVDVEVHGWALLGLRLGITVVLAEATTRGVEAVLHLRSWSPAWGRRSVLAAALVVVVTGLVGTAAAPVSTPVFYVSPTTTIPPTTTTVRPTTTTTVRPTTTTTAAPTTTTAAPVTTTTVRPLVPVTAPPVTTTVVVPPPTTVALPPPSSTVPPAPAGPFRVVAVGESVLLGAGGAVQRALGPGTIIDADIARQPDDVLDALQARRKAGHLDGIDVLVVQLGTNGVIKPKHLDRLAALAAGVPRVVAVTVHVPRPWQDASNAALRAAAGRYPWLRLADWHAAVAGHPEWLGSDGVHVGRAGAARYAEVVAAAARAA